MRIVEAMVLENKCTSLESVYHEKIMPVLEQTPGCRIAFLVDNTGNNNEMLSFTIWDNSEAVMLYEKERAFDTLLSKVRNTLDELYQWKMALESRKDAAITVTSKDININACKR